MKEYFDTAAVAQKLLQNYAMEKFKKANTYDDEDLEHRANVSAGFNIIEISNQLEVVIHQMGKLATILAIVGAFFVVYSVAVTILYINSFS